MARVYLVTEEELHSLIDSVELVKLRADANGPWVRENEGRPEAMKDALHRAFHLRVVRWAQAVGLPHRGY